MMQGLIGQVHAVEAARVDVAELATAGTLWGTLAVGHNTVTVGVTAGHKRFGAVTLQGQLAYGRALFMSSSDAARKVIALAVGLALMAVGAVVAAFAVFGGDDSSAPGPRPSPSTPTTCMPFAVDCQPGGGTGGVSPTPLPSPPRPSASCAPFDWPCSTGGTMSGSGGSTGGATPVPSFPGDDCPAPGGSDGGTSAVSPSDLPETCPEAQQAV